MSENTNSTPQNDEVDLGQLFNVLGKLFKNLIDFVKSILKNIFRGSIYTLKPLVNNIKIVTGLIVLSAILGFVYEQTKKDVFISDMIVRPYFDSQYQLVNNIDYFNSLVAEGNRKMLSSIFDIDEEKSESLVDFSIEIAPETKNALLQQYDAYLKTLDSTLATTIEFDDFVENRNIFSGKMLKIIVRSEDQEIFTELESGFSKTFNNRYAEKNKKRRDSSLVIQRLKLERDLKRVDSVQKIYIEVLKTDAEKQTVVLPTGGMPVTQEKSKTREYELLQEEIKIRNALKELDEQLIVESDFYDIISPFSATGAKDRGFFTQYRILFPMIALTLLIVGFITVKIFNYIKDYE